MEAGVTSYYHADGLGSVNALSRTNGSYDEAYKSDSFGMRLSYDGSATNPFQYTARGHSRNHLCRRFRTKP